LAATTIPWVELFHIVHEIEAEGGRRAGIEGGKDARLAISLDPFRALKAGVFQELDHVIGSLRISAILSRDRDLADPIL
jgi:hypothetical protein